MLVLFILCCFVLMVVFRNLQLFYQHSCQWFASIMKTKSTQISQLDWRLKCVPFFCSINTSSCLLLHGLCPQRFRSYLQMLMANRFSAQLLIWYFTFSQCLSCLHSGQTYNEVQRCFLSVGLVYPEDLFVFLINVRSFPWCFFLLLSVYLE